MSRPSIAIDYGSICSGIEAATVDSRPQPGSPNWHWQQLGYSVERTGQRRTIRRPDGSAVEIDQREGERRHDAEVRAALAERFPHDRAECAAGQLDIFTSSGPTT